jgi:hypothetical protein
MSDQLVSIYIDNIIPTFLITKKHRYKRSKNSEVGQVKTIAYRINISII